MKYKSKETHRWCRDAAVAVTRPHDNRGFAPFQDETRFTLLFFSSRTYPDHLLCAAPPSRPALRPQQPRDQDSLASSGVSVAALGASFSPDRYADCRQPKNNSVIYFNI